MRWAGGTKPHKDPKCGVVRTETSFVETCRGGNERGGAFSTLPAKNQAWRGEAGQQSRDGRAANLVAVRFLRAMSLSRPLLVLALAFCICGPLGEPFCVQNTCLTGGWIGVDPLSLTRTTCRCPALPRSMRVTTALAQGQRRYTGSNNHQGGSLVKVQGTESVEATGSEGKQHTK